MILLYRLDLQPQDMKKKRILQQLPPCLSPGELKAGGNTRGHFWKIPWNTGCMTEYAWIFHGVFKGLSVILPHK
jgi:hypothetical protein